MATMTSNPAEMRSQPQTRAITIAILAMGGEGGGVLADWIVDVAENAGHLAQATSVPGVAQRTGTTIYYVELFAEAAAKDAGKEPVLALMPVPGEVDIVIASELMEAGRAVQRGLVTPDRTTLIASSNRVYSMTERIAAGDGRVDASALLDSCRSASKRFLLADFSQLAEDAKSVISAVLFGALAGSAVLPFERETYEAAIRRAGVGVESSLAGFSAGWKAITEQHVEPPAQAGSIKLGPKLQPLAKRITAEFPQPVHETLYAAILRVADYQDVRYAAEYLDRLKPVVESESKFGKGTCALLRETARYLALWMSYEDASRVADLKIRRSRFERVRQETQAGNGQLVQIREFLHPGVNEIADTLPAGLGRWLVNSRWMSGLITKMTRRGQVVQTTSLSGFILLCLVAGQRRWRRSSYRYQIEQARIQEWMGLVMRTAERDYALAVEVAESAQLIKGYGDTHARGSRNFEAIMHVVPRFTGKSGSAAQLVELRSAALADDSGQRLADALKRIDA